ncbi:hypothetical protein EGW08_005561 [Elysia chlorotica]|uniref:Uncharacterized protein n=1 Tax=Elysia chlorotica TaxID=188477 RepID=A0A433TYQ6_ELYCH|nr:hypothetical protein EGW08_005561 [Elysia chlorotica]
MYQPLVTERPSLIRLVQGPLGSEVTIFTPYIEHTVRLHNSPVRKVEAGQDMYNHIARVTLLNHNSPLAEQRPNPSNAVFKIETKSDDADFSLETDFLRATFSGVTGRLKAVTTLTDGVTHKSELEFIQYGTRAHKDKSGAYLFLPNGEAKMQKRKYYSKLTLQGNVYPMPTMAYLQDEGKRLSVLSSQSSGVANLVVGTTRSEWVGRENVEGGEEGETKMGRKNGEEVNPAEIFSDLELRSSTVTSLTMTSDLAELKPGTAVQVPPMEILAVRVELS